MSSPANQNKPAREWAYNTPARLFIEFQYPEIKDLLKHFLTLISGALVFSVTFSEKIVGFDKAPSTQKQLLLIAWLSLILALGCCGFGLYTLYLAAERAIAEEVSNIKTNFENVAKRSYMLQDLSGVLFGLGLFLLVVAAALNFFH